MQSSQPSNQRGNSSSPCSYEKAVVRVEMLESRQQRLYTFPTIIIIIIIRTPSAIVSVCILSARHSLNQHLKTKINKVLKIDTH
jgi:hypothetical protein